MMQTIARPHRRGERLDTVNRFLTFAIVLMILGAMGISFIPIFRKTKKLKESLSLKTQELQEKILLQKKRMRELKLLQSHPVYLETIARDKLDLMKPGETIFRSDNKK